MFSCLHSYCSTLSSTLPSHIKHLHFQVFRLFKLQYLTPPRTTPPQNKKKKQKNKAHFPHKSGGETYDPYQHMIHMHSYDPYMAPHWWCKKAAGNPVGFIVLRLCHNPISGATANLRGWVSGVTPETYMKIQHSKPPRKASRGFFIGKVFYIILGVNEDSNG